MTNVPTRIFRALRSPRFFAVIVGLFVIESVWMAVSAVYPMVFDENVHFSVIQLYAHQWSPFFPAHASYVEPAGALSHDPSFLFRYLMAFPYRLIAAITSNQTIQIVCLRLIDVALFAGALVVFRRLLLKTKASPAVVHVALLLFILLPVVPLLSGQINYDNLVMLVAGGALLLAMSVDERLARGRLPVTRILWLATLCLLGSLVQVEFLPILLAVVLWFAWRLWRLNRARRLPLAAALHKAGRKASRPSQVLVGIVLVISAGLFLRMYGVNLVRYHAVLPRCNRVLSDQQCSPDANWVRTEYDLAHKGHVDINPLRFTAGWAYRLMVGLFYTSSGGAPKVFYLSVNPLPIVFGGALLIFGLGFVLLLIYGRAIFRRYDHLGFLLFVILLYVAALWLNSYSNYVELGDKVGINGRYLAPVIPPAMLLIGLAYRQWLSSWRPALKVGLLIAVLLIFSQGGGLLTYLTVSNADWYWQNHAVIRLNRDAQSIVRPLVIDKRPVGSI